MSAGENKARMRLKRRAEQAAAADREKKKEGEMIVLFATYREELAKALGCWDAECLAVQCSTEQGRGALAKGFINAARVRRPDFKPFAACLDCWPLDGEYWPAARDIVQVAEQGDEIGMRECLQDVAGYTTYDQAEVWACVAGAIGLLPFPLTRGSAAEAPPDAGGAAENGGLARTDLVGPASQTTGDDTMKHSAKPDAPIGAKNPRANPFAERDAWIAEAPGPASQVKKKLNEMIDTIHSHWKRVSISRINAIKRKARQSG